MGYFLILGLLAIAGYFFFKKPSKVDLSHLPPRFVIFDLETTGLDADKHEIIEIGAIRVNRDSTMHEAFEGLIKPNKKLSKKIIEITGITQEKVDKEGEPLDYVIRQFLEFIGDLPLVSFNAPFDIAFLSNAVQKQSLRLNNPVSCALDMARRAWPDRTSYRLAELAKDGNLSSENTHRALGDCKRTLTVYTAAANRLRTTQ